ncbi:MAG: hypothetical protein IKZ88_09710 [Neisseriaceae bacterium]|nr:hypothetical protein [Neisseriaceae bacterium]
MGFPAHRQTAGLIIEIDNFQIAKDINQRLSALRWVGLSHPITDAFFVLIVVVKMVSGSLKNHFSSGLTTPAGVL